MRMRPIWTSEMITMRVWPTVGLADPLESLLVVETLNAPSRWAPECRRLVGSGRRSANCENDIPRVHPIESPTSR